MAVEYRLAFSSNLTLDTCNNFKSRIATILERPDFGRLVILFSSEGGITDQSLSLHNFILSLPVHIHMHAVGHVGSASVPVFLAGAVRSCTPLARFFFHEYDWGFDGRQTIRRIAEADKRLRNDIDMAREIIKARTKAADDILNALDGTSAPVVLSPDAAKRFGFVENICDLGQQGANGMSVAIWT